MSAFARKLRSTVVERDHPQDGINLTYFGTPTSAGTGAGDIYAGLDRFGRVADQKWVDANNADASVEEYQYSYDRDGNVASQVNPNNTANNETFTYDNLNQLTGVSSANSSLEQSFDLDALGNADTITNGTVSTDAALNSQNQLTGLGAADLTYDADGNTVVDEQGHVQVYDAWGRLIAVADGVGNPLAAYGYDAAGRRVSETLAGNPSSAIYFSGSQDVEEDQANGSMTFHMQYVWSPVYVNALVSRDEVFNIAGTFNVTERVYALQDANYDVTALVTSFTEEGDIDGDGFVDFLDFNVIFNNFGQTVAGGDAAGDLNHDGVVDDADLQLWLNNDGNTYTGPPTWQVSERLTYNADGAFTTSVLTVNSDDTMSWTADASEYLGWNITYQGGQYDALTNLVHFGGGTDGAEGGRAVDVLTGRWTSWDPTGYPNGPDAYLVEGGNTVNGLDPSGERHVVVAFEGLKFGPHDWVQEEWEPIVARNDPLAKQHYVAYNVDTSALLKTVKREVGCDGSVILLGFSFGGDTAIHFADQLTKSNIKVAFGFTVDPRQPPLGTTFTYSMPKNVGWWINYYENGETGTPPKLDLRGSKMNGGGGGEIGKDEFQEFVNKDTSLDYVYSHAHSEGYVVRLTFVKNVLALMLQMVPKGWFD